MWSKWQRSEGSYTPRSGEAHEYREERRRSPSRTSRRGHVPRGQAQTRPRRHSCVCTVLTGAFA
eukprot:5827793-Lingulodinium_polyedra.AAC.1